MKDIGSSRKYATRTSKHQRNSPASIRATQTIDIPKHPPPIQLPGQIHCPSLWANLGVGIGSLSAYNVPSLTVETMGVLDTRGNVGKS